MAEIASNTPTAEEIPALSETLVQLADRLAAVLARETALIGAMRVAEIGPLQAEKTSLAALYQKNFKALVAAQNGKPVATEMKKRLVAAGTTLAAAVKENERMLRVGKTATERLITSIVAAVREDQRATSAYAPQRSPAPRRAFMTAAALDRRL